MKKRTMYTLAILLYFINSNVSNAQIANVQDRSFEKNDSIKLFSAKAYSNIQLPNTDVEYPRFPYSYPEMSPFQRFITHEIAEHNGTTDISIPLYEMKIDDDLTLPITLVYHSGGIKYKQPDGDYGVGWSLSVGGFCITKSLKGRLDEEYHHFEEPNEFTTSDMKTHYDKYKNQSHNLFLDKFISKIYESPLEHHKNITNIDLFAFNSYMYTKDVLDAASEINGMTVSFDSEYDQYNYNLPTTNGLFIMTNSLNKEMVTIHQFKNNNDKIKIPYRYYDNKSKRHRYQSFTIVDDRGITYATSNTPISIITSPPPFEISDLEKTYFQDTSWPLETIVTPRGGRVDFKYIERLSVSDRRSRCFSMTDAEELSAIVPVDQYSPIHWSESDVAKDPWKYRNYNQDINYHSLYKIRTPYERLRIVGSTIIIEAFDNNNRGEVTNYQPIKYIELKKELLDEHYVLKKIEIKSSKEQKTGSDVYSFDYYEPLEKTGELYPDNWGYYANAFYINQSGEDQDDIFLHQEFLDDPRLISPYDPSPLRTNYATVATRYKKKMKWVDRYVPSANFYSLKSVTYPTGAINTYIYEPHEFYGTDSQIMYGGGQRVKEIISEGSNGEFRQTSYQYGIGKANIELTHKDYVSFNHTLSIKGFWVGGLAIIPYYTGILSRSYSEQPFLSESGQFMVQYSTVKKTEFHNNNEESTVVSDYIIPDMYKVSLKQFLAAPKKISAVWDKVVNRYVHPNTKAISIYSPGYSPVLKQKEYYNSKKDLIKREKYDYYEKIPYQTPNKIRGGIRAKNYHKLRSTAITGGGDEFNYHKNVVTGLYQHWEYFIQPGGYVLKSENTELFNYSAFNSVGKSKVVSTNLYTYNKYNQPLVTTIKGSRETINEQISFLTPDTQYSDPVLQNLADRNMFNTLLSKTISSNATEIGNMKYTYRDDLYVGGEKSIPRLATIHTSNTTKESLREVLSYDKYDERGNLVQYTGMDGLTVSYVWAYNWRYPIIEAKNVDYDTLKKELNNLDFYGDARGGLHFTSNIDFEKLSEIRNRLPKAEITIYQFKPSIGITRVIDSKGVSTYYEYNDANKLYRIKDHHNSVLEEYFYHTIIK